MRRWTMVAAGGACGAALRWAVDAAFDSGSTAFPWGTLVVNLVGCLAIGLAARRWDRRSDVWHVAVVGVLGGLTTFSTFAVETDHLIRSDRAGLAAAYVVVSLAGGLVATELAMRRGFGA